MTFAFSWPVWAVSALLCLVPRWGNAESSVFYVSTKGNDRWSGRLPRPDAAGSDGPFASLAAARDQVRRLKPRGPLQGPVEIELRGGTYYLDRGLLLAPEDSGTEACPVIYRAYRTEKPILCGGIRLTQWKPYRGQIWSCSLPADRLGGTLPKQLFYRGVRQVLARYPNRDANRPRTGGFLYMDRPVQESGKWFFWRSADAFPRKWSNPEDVEIDYFDGTGYLNSIVPLRQLVDAKRRIIAPAFPGMPCTNSGNRFFIRNALEELDSPGEWYYDRQSGTVYFWPPDDRLQLEGAVVPRIVDLIVCRGDYDKGRFVRHVAFEHLGLESCHQDGVVLEAAEHCQVIGCTLTNIGRTAIFLGEGSRNCRVAGNDIACPGGQAVATAPGVNTPKETADHIITNNHAHHCGETWVCGVGWGSGIFIAGRRHTVSHNLVHDTPYNPINFTGYDHVIELNHCHHGVMECFDGAGIYGWVDPKGGSGRNLVRFNRIHDIVGYGIPWTPSPKIPDAFQSPYFAWGVYLDDELCDTAVLGDLVYRAPGGMLLHGGWNTRVENNIFIDGANEQVLISNMQPDKYAAVQKTPAAALPGSMSNNTFRRNIFSLSRPQAALYRCAGWLDQAATFRQNLVYHPGSALKIQVQRHGSTSGESAISWEQWQARGQDAASLVADSRFVDPARDDYRLRPDSPAVALGFEPAPTERAGLYQDRERAERAEAPMPPVEIRQGGYVERVDPTVDYRSRLVRRPPCEPAESLKKFHLVPGFVVELAASEPQICSPVDAVFDEHGRLYVAQMIPYAENNSAAYGSPNGRVVMLEDRDGDGTFETITVFCDNLVWPTGLACFDGGLFVAAAPDLLYLKDTNGDGKADVREQVVSGFHTNNPAAVPNSLRWGPDNRLHAMPSQGGGELRALRWERSQRREEKPVSIRGRDFSLDPRSGQLRPESGGGQHGMAFDDWGTKYESSNSTPIAMIMYEDRYLARNPALAAPPARLDIWIYGSAIYRTSPPEAWRVIRMEMRKAGVFSGPIEGGGSPVGYFTGACGLFMPRPGAWPAADRQDGFLAEGSSNLVHRMRLRPNGVPYAAYRVEEKRDFLTSDECWFRPVQFCGGPDGNLYVVDLYRECYEHPDAVPPSVKKHMDLSTGKDRGRIYRVVPEGFRRGPLLLPGKLSTAHLVGLLAHPNGWHRETASRLLYERQDRSAVGPLEKLAVGPDPLGRLHAMYALDGLNALSAEVVLARLADPHPRVREHAVRLAERVLDKSPKVREALCTMAGDKDIRVRYQLAFTLGEFPGPASTAALVKIAAQDPDDRWIGLAVFSSCFGRSGDLLGRLTEDRTWRTRDEARSLLERLAEQVGLEDREPQVGVVLRVLAGIGHDEDRLAQALVRGLSHGLAQSGSPLRQKLARDSARAARILVEIIEHAKQTARQEDRNLASRIEAVHAMALAPFADVRDTLRELLTGRSPQELQMAVLQMLRRFSEPESAKMITAAWPGFSPAVRSEAAEVLFGRKAWLPVLLEAVENKTILAGQIDPARLQVLLTHPEPAIRKKAESLLANDKLGRRQDVIAAHRDVLKMKGDAARGKAVFKRECATCHRLEDVGFELGLPLTSVQNKGREFMLLNILDPNLQVLPEYVNYVALTTEGRSVTGMIVSETASSITLRRAEGQSDTVLRTNLEELQSTGLSIMPEGLETKLSKQDLADVIEYLMSIK